MTTDTRLAELHASLADERRLEMVRALGTQGELASGALADLTGLTQTRASQHLLFLKRGGVVTSRKEGLHVYYRLRAPLLYHALELLHAVLRPPTDEPQ